MDQTKRVLFVDDQPQVLRGIQRMIEPWDGSWSALFAASGEEALQLIAREPVDVIVADMRMVGMDGAELLSRVAECAPNVVRIVLSGEADENAVLRAVRPMHQYLSKPCNPEALRASIERAFALRDCLGSETLKSLVSRMSAVPSLPDTCRSLSEELSSPEPSLTRVEELVLSDVGMTAKVLQLVNSAAFGLPRPMASVRQAVSILGTATLKSLILTVHAFEQFDIAKSRGFRPRQLMIHSLWTGNLARRIARLQDAPVNIVEQSFAAGMLHDVGKLIIASELETQFDEIEQVIEQERIPEVDAERRVLGVTHAEIGAFLLSLWGLPEPIVQATAFHHHPADATDLSQGPLLFVHVANALVHESDHSRSAPAELHQEYLEGLSVANLIDHWRDVCISTTVEG